MNGQIVDLYVLSEERTDFWLEGPSITSTELSVNQ